MRGIQTAEGYHHDVLRLCCDYHYLQSKWQPCHAIKMHRQYIWSCWNLYLQNIKKTLLSAFFFFHLLKETTWNKNSAIHFLNTRNSSKSSLEFQLFGNAVVIGDSSNTSQDKMHESSTLTYLPHLWVVSSDSHLFVGLKVWLLTCSLWQHSRLICLLCHVIHWTVTALKSLSPIDHEIGCVSENQHLSNLI